MRSCPKCSTKTDAELCPNCWTKNGRTIPTNAEDIITDPAPFHHPEAPQPETPKPEPAKGETQEQIPPPAAASEKPKHHPHYAPSSFHRRAACPKSKSLEASAPKSEKPNPDADEGTQMHTWTAQLLKGGPMPVEATQEQKEILEQTVFFIKNLAGKNPIDTEVEIQIFDKNINTLTYGTLDVFIQSGDDKGITVELKFGRGNVDPTDRNWQVALYAFGAAWKYGLAEIEAHIFQPRIKSHSINIFTEFDNLQNSIIDIISKCEDPNATINPGPHCNYCRATLCPHKLEIISTISEIKPANNINHIAELPPEKLAEYFLKCKELKKIIESIEYAAKEYAFKNGGRCGPLVLAEGRKTREIKDIRAAYDNLADLLSMEEFLTAIKGISLPTLEEKLAAKTGLKKAEAARRLETVLGDLITYKQGEKILKLAAE